MPRIQPPTPPDAEPIATPRTDGPCAFCHGYESVDCECLQWLKRGFDSDPEMAGQAEFYMERGRQLERELQAARQQVEKLESERENWRVSSVCRELQAKVDELTALIAKSSLIEVDAAKCVDRGGHPVIVKDGTMLVHKDYLAREEQRTKDLQAHAATARKLAAAQSENASLTERCRGLDEALQNCGKLAKMSFSYDSRSKLLKIIREALAATKTKG